MPSAKQPSTRSLPSTPTPKPVRKVEKQPVSKSVSATCAHAVPAAATEIHAGLVRISRKLAARLAVHAPPPPAAFVYHPIAYAREPHERYLALARPHIDALFLGMNPGPFGMVQTGVPFGEVDAARAYLGIEGRVVPPTRTHPKRPVEGFACARSEVSGKRFWGLFAREFPSRDACFRRIFVWNYCPLAFVADSGANMTPDKLPRDARDALEAPCDDALREIVALLRPRLVVGVGAFARAAAVRALGSIDAPPEIGQVLHPSPASPAANRGWAEQARVELVRLGVLPK